ncbi:MAG: nucleoside recognition protein [Lachnospiraceae bacterium]|nr:nucleoside recognition protein [Lachnospiraceae bacterium]
MLNHIWAAMLLAGFIYGVLTGKLQGMTDSMLQASGDAVDLSITLLGVIAFWCGIMEIAQEAGLVKILSRKMKPVIHFLFPDVPENHRALDSISMNFIANVLGLGWAATPAGLEAMEGLAELEDEKRIRTNGNSIKKVEKKHGKQEASNEMCTFLVLNISSLQLLPVNIIAYRIRYGSEVPAAVVGPAVLATSVSTAAAVIFCRFMNRKKN